MLTYALWTAAGFVFLGTVMLATDWVAVRWERREKERWNKAFGGSTAARSGGRRDG